MNNIMSLVMSVIFAVALTMVVGFVVASIQGYSYEFASALPYGIIIGILVYLLGTAVTAGER